MKGLKELKTIVLLIGIMIAMAGCSVGDTDGSADYNTEASSSNAAGWGVYEGEWTVNKQVVDTARLVVAATMRVRLPEQYLLGLCFPGSMDKTSPIDVKPGNTTAKIGFMEQGYSEQSLYMAFTATTTQTADAQLLYNTCSFEAVVNGVPCRIGLLSKENGSAVLRNMSGQWTLAIPVSAFLVTDLTTGQSDTRELAGTTTIYYNTKQRIG
jgi:hypothetical protein